MLRIGRRLQRCCCRHRCCWRNGRPAHASDATAAACGGCHGGSSDSLPPCAFQVPPPPLICLCRLPFTSPSLPQLNCTWPPLAACTSSAHRSSFYSLRARPNKCMCTCATAAAAPRHRSRQTGTAAERGSALICAPCPRSPPPPPCPPADQGGWGSTRSTAAACRSTCLKRQTQVWQPRSRPAPCPK